MKKTVFVIALLQFSCFLFAQDLSLEEILQKNYKATNLDKLRQVQCITMDGKANAMGMEFSYTQYQKRPNKVRIEAEVQGTMMVQAFDGTNAWMQFAMMGPDPIDLTGAELKGMKSMGDIEGDLYNWKEKGFQVEYIGKEDYTGQPAYTLRLTKPEGDTFTYYIDATSNLVMMVKARISYEGKEIESESTLSNYQEVEGIMIPFQIEQKSEQQSMKITIEKVSFNSTIEDEKFIKPKKQ